MTETALYSVRPSFAEKFRPATVKTLIGSVLSERLADKTCASAFTTGVRRATIRAACCAARTAYHSSTLEPPVALSLPCTDTTRS